MPIDLTLYALDTITDTWQFEKLCSDLLFREGFKNLKPHGGMHDRGIDALIHVHETNSRIEVDPVIWTESRTFVIRFRLAQ